MDVPRGWLYFGIYSLYLLVNMVVFLKWAPDVVRTRGELPKMRSWDLAFAIVYMIGLLLMPLLLALMSEDSIGQ